MRHFIICLSTVFGLGCGENIDPHADWSPWSHSKAHLVVDCEKNLVVLDELKKAASVWNNIPDPQVTVTAGCAGGPLKPWHVVVHVSEIEDDERDIYARTMRNTNQLAIIQFNSLTNFTYLGDSGGSDEIGISFVYVAAHEIGHIMGIFHVEEQGATMRSFYQHIEGYGEDGIGLSEHDIKAYRAIFGQTY